MIESDLTGRIIGSLFGTHRHFGFGFPEGVYSNALAVELRFRGLEVQREVPIEVLYRGVAVGTFRLDMVIERCVVVEVKSCAEIAPIHERQLLNYLHASTFELGLLVNFGPKPTFKRLVYSNDRKQAPRSPL
ncbi:MAG TPA: GxxExxY protein [Gemmatimonadaceae bacterium]|nr:GxxExxY protein [Gemmatimonadaceae bacterium]